MLVLSRKRYEAVTIGHDVTITIISISGDRVRLGIEAPKSTSVRRGEIVELIAAQAAERKGGAA